MDDIRILRYCENCEDKITDERKEYYITDDGVAFCCLECCLEHFNVVKVEEW